MFFLVVSLAFATELSSIPSVTGSVVDEAVLFKGGKLALSAFKPGPGAEAGDQTDKISAMLLRGITQALSTRPLPLAIIEGEGADFVLDGYIEDLAQSGRFSRLVLRQKKAGLSVDGEIWSQASGRKVLLLGIQRSSTTPSA